MAIHLFHTIIAHPSANALGLAVSIAFSVCAFAGNKKAKEKRPMTRKEKLQFRAYVICTIMGAYFVSYGLATQMQSSSEGLLSLILGFLLLCLAFHLIMSLFSKSDRIDLHRDMITLGL